MDQPVQGDRRTIAGRYTLLGRLGTGGMGTVWRAQDVVLGREVAVKEIVFPHGLPDDEREVLRERTRREARAAARLDHPSAVTVYDVVEENGSPYLVMELVEARTLAEVVRADGPLSPRQAADVGLAVLGALETAHRQGIVHRDVKPGNVLLSPGPDGPAGRVVLTDFGIATSSGDSSITSTGLILGSPSYIAPERCRGQAPGPPSDLWSLGATLFTAVEGRPPYDGGDPLATVTAVVTGEHAPFVAAGPLEPVIAGLLERDPELRLDAAAARTGLQQVVRNAASTTMLAHAPAPAPEQGRRADRTTALPIGAMQHAASPAAVAEAPLEPPVVAPPRPRQSPASRPPRPATEPRRRSAALPLVLATVLVVAALLGGFALLSAGDDPSTTAAPGSSATPSTQPSDAPTAEPSEGEGDGDGDAGGAPVPGVEPPPEGWQTFTGEPGFAVAVPPTYAEGSFDGQPQYRDPASRRTLRVTTTGEGGGKDDAVEDRRDQAASFAARHPSYQEIGISRAEYRGYEAADWELTYESGGAALHVINRVFVVDGRGYSLWFQTLASDDRAAVRAEFEQIAASFVPAS